MTSAPAAATAAPPSYSARRAATRDRLMAAATTVFAERGIIGASVEEICEAAGFTRGAFYSNFADKDELVLAMLRHEIETQYVAARRVIDMINREPERAEAVQEALAAFESETRADRQWILTQQELLLYAARQPQVRTPYQEFAAGYREQFGALIAEGIQAAGLRLRVPFDDAIALLTSCHHQDQLDGLLDQRVGGSRLRLMLELITQQPDDRS